MVAKLRADAAFRNGAETRRTNEDAKLARHRSQESGANRRKLDADTAYRKGPETKRTSAEARLATQRSQESGANRRKLDADTAYRKGPETKRTSAEARLAKRRSKESGANRRKLDADTTYRKGPETLLASAEAILASARAAEANAAEAVRRAEAIERRANVGRIEAEALERTANAEFTSGARTRSERARARESRSVAFKNYASVLSGPAQLIGFLGVLYGFARYVFFQNFSEESCGRKIAKTLDTMVSRVFFSLNKTVAIWVKYAGARPLHASVLAPAHLPSQHCCCDDQRLQPAWTSGRQQSPPRNHRLWPSASGWARLRRQEVAPRCCYHWPAPRAQQLVQQLPRQGNAVFGHRLPDGCVSAGKR
jgi:hypothetical protein